ncbi:retinaldehyde-binding protein 1 [Aedes albopictus]|uniref:CRAL-TRIO domain-containing protein n=1 Tax=Aedes albopictus TaxID=7160 RepID=A0ABM1Z8M3_AEDAL
MKMALGMDKKPLVYDQYKTTLGPEDLRRAKEQLHEDENSREPALAQLREYIAKHPQIVRCRTDAVFLLRFLRARKFNVQAACEMLDDWLQTGVRAADFYKLKPDEWDRFLDQAIIIPLGSDEQGRMVIICRFGLFDAETVTPEEQIRLATLVLESFLDIDSYQVNGMVLLLDFQGAKMAHFGVWTIPKLKTLISATNDILPIRLKEIHLIQLPKYTTVLVDFCLSVMKPKLQKRVKFHKSLDELKAAVDSSILPTIYGGSLSLEEANDRFRKRVAQERDHLLLINEFEMDLTKPNPHGKTSKNGSGLQSDIADEAVIGSFRKLNVD